MRIASALPTSLPILSNPFFDTTNRINRSEQILLSRVRSEQPHSRRNDRERVSRARQAAEALFTPKPPVSRSSAPAAESGEPPRKPRVLQIVSSTEPVRHQAVEAPVSRRQQRASKSPASEAARIRSWLKYGMTRAEVAEVYGVLVGEIERILGRA